MNLESENIVDLNEWKTNKKDSNFSSYLKVLSFNELMNESNELMTQMKDNEPVDDIFTKTKLMMNEFTMRLEKESRHLAEQVKDLKKQIEDKLH